ncbi:MAG: DUF2147 domain-containing protein [Caulobacteraceae bacterium]
MRRIRGTARAAACALGLVALAAWAPPAASPLGLWWTKGRQAVVDIEPCGQALCGRLVGLPRQRGEAIPTDSRGRSQCGETIIRGARPTGGGDWLGKVADPRTGATYRARLWMDERGELHLRGYIFVPLLGRSQVWRRFDGHLDATCFVS